MTLALILPPSFHCENFQILEKLISRTPIFSLLYAKCFTFYHIGRCVCGCVYIYIYIYIYILYIYIFTCVVLGGTDLIVAHMSL